MSDVAAGPRRVLGPLSVFFFSVVLAGAAGGALFGLSSCGPSGDGDADAGSREAHLGREQHGATQNAGAEPVRGEPERGVERVVAATPPVGLVHVAPPVADLAEVRPKPAPLPWLAPVPGSSSGQPLRRLRSRLRQRQKERDEQAVKREPCPSEQQILPSSPQRASGPPRAVFVLAQEVPGDPLFVDPCGLIRSNHPSQHVQTPPTLGKTQIGR